MWLDLRRALGFLTILPVGTLQAEADLRAPGKAFAWFPLVGVPIGALVATVAWLVPDWLAGYAALATWVVLTGGLHLDGYADACDALLATTTPERRLEIMKDPRVGSWAVIGLILLLLGKFVALAQVSSWALIAVPVAARWAMTVAAWYFPYARTQGLGGYFRQGLGMREVTIASICALVILLLLALADWRVLALLLVAPVVLLAVGVFARTRLGGGVTGDIYGAICEITEWATLLVVALLPAAFAV